MRLLCPQEEEKTKKEVLGKMRQTLTGEVARSLAVGESPRFFFFFFASIL